MKGTSRRPSHLSEALHRQLNSYALAATAAGVGTLALGQPAEAKIIYTPANVVITLGSPYALDLNNDGIGDFHLSASVSNGLFHSFLSVKPYDAFDLIWGSDRGASALHAGVTIRQSKRLQPTNTFMASNSGGQWFNVQHRYLGLQFDIDGEVHYGWARLNADWFTISMTLTGYAYETVPNKPIKTGKTKGPDVITTEPATLGKLALGRR